MSRQFAQRLTDALRQRIGQGEGQVQVVGDEATIAVEVEACERYAVGVRGIRVAPAASTIDVRETAERIAREVRALDEDLRVVEQDVALGRAIVRSAEPERDEAGVGYWEVDVQPQEVALRRYRKDHSRPEREVETAPLPYAVVGRVAEELAGAVSAGA